MTKEAGGLSLEESAVLELQGCWQRLMIPGLPSFQVTEDTFGAFGREVQRLGQAKVQTLRELMAPLERGAPRFYPQIQAQKYRVQATWERLNKALEVRREVGRVSGSMAPRSAHSTAPSRLSLIPSQNLAAARELRSFEQAASELQGWMQEKTTQLEGEFRVHSLSPTQLLQQHKCLQVKASRGLLTPAPLF